MIVPFGVLSVVCQLFHAVRDLVTRVSTRHLVSISQRLQKGDNGVFLLLGQSEVAKLPFVQIR
jgi:hypothetical protein